MLVLAPMLRLLDQFSTVWAQSTNTLVVPMKLNSIFLKNEEQLRTMEIAVISVAELFTDLLRRSLSLQTS